MIRQTEYLNLYVVNAIHFILTDNVCTFIHFCTFILFILQMSKLKFKTTE
jgi:hypothetical protein